MNLPQLIKLINTHGVASLECESWCDDNESNVFFGLRMSLKNGQTFLFEQEVQTKHTLLRPVIQEDVDGDLHVRMRMRMPK
jgi:hypothetical protein